MDDIKHMCDTNNKTCPEGEVLASTTVHDMESHNTQMIEKMLLGNFSTVPLVSLTEKRVKLSVVR